jgi:NAD(P)-dependent dehydrogenase (short-subunit alcohol dehydrogenase family)
MVNGFTAQNVRNQSGRTILITGANSGIGFGVARVLAGKGGRVILACRSETKAREAMACISSENPSAKLDLLPLDLADIASVRAAADRVGAIDVLVNNAGIMTPPLRLTGLGVELQFATNHLGHFALTALLLPKIGGADPRVVTVASIAHRRGSIDFDNLDGSKGYGAMKFYSQSKLANMLLFAELDRRLRSAGSPTRSVGCHPGFAGTNLGKGWLGELMFGAAGVFFNNSDQGAWPTLQAATDPAVAGGDYYGPQQLFETRGPSGKAARTAMAADPQLAAQLWDASVELTGIDPGLPPA